MIGRTLLTALAPLALAACATVPQPAPLPATGVVSAADPRAAEAGMAMLRRGGSATDAAIAVMLALTVVEPQSSGIGGGGFFLHTGADGAVESLDGRERAPAGADPQWFLGDDGQPQSYGDVVLTGLSIGVPGSMALAAEAHERHGRLPWAELFQPAIALARDGWVASERFAGFLENSAPRAARTEEGRALFYDTEGEPVTQGTRLTNPALARTMEMLAANGPGAFYEGAFAEGLATTAREATPRAGGMTQADLADYSAVWRAPVCGSYREYRICGMGPPSSGATTVYAILKQLEGFDLAALGPRDATAWHLFAESQRLAYADREIFLADGDYVTVPVDWLTDADYLARRGALIRPDARLATVEAGTPPPPLMARADGDEPVEAGTSHFAVVDAAGNAVSYTSTIEGAFGSGHVYRGFYLNNELTDFSRSPTADGAWVANRVEGGKRPRSSMSPTLVFDGDGQLVIAIGAAGGGTIPVQVAKSLIGMIDWGLGIQEAIALPVLYSPGDTITIEEGSWLAGYAPALEALGHTVTARGLPLKANGIALENGRWVGAADPRSEGVALGQ